MILVDTSVWIDHLRRGNTRLDELLQNREVLCHPCVIGELACGNLRNRAELLSLWHALPEAPAVEPHEVLALLEGHHLHGLGLGWVDLHLLASARLGGTPLLTLDRRLATVAARLRLSA